MARNRQRAKERQARRKAQQAKDPNAGKPGPTRRSGGDPIADDVLDELEREAAVDPGQDPPTPPPLSESERLRAGAPPQDAGSSSGVLEYEQALDGEDGEEHFDPEIDAPEEALSEARADKERAEGHRQWPRFIMFLIAVRAELRRVQWPDRQALTTLTGVVLGFVLIAGGYLGLLDAIVSRVMQAIL